MQIVVRLDKVDQPAVCSFAHPADLREISKWQQLQAASQDADVLDAQEFAALAGKRWRSYLGMGRTISSLAELTAAKVERPDDEYVFMAVATAKLPTLPPVLGCCLFRRTWCNHIVLDLLTSHPDLVAGRFGEVSGVGIGLVAFAARLAVRLNSAVIWCETTRSSARRYAKWFNLPSVDDVLRVTRPDYQRFLDTARNRWKKSGLTSDPDDL